MRACDLYRTVWLFRALCLLNEGQVMLWWYAKQKVPMAGAAFWWVGGRAVVPSVFRSERMAQR